MHCLNVLNFKYMYHVVSFEFRNTFSIIEKVCMLLFNGVLSVFNEEGQTCWIFSIVWSHFLDRLVDEQLLLWSMVIGATVFDFIDKHNLFDDKVH